MKYISTKQAAEKWDLTPRRVVTLAQQGRIEGAALMANRWLIPEDAQKPGRIKRHQKEPQNEYIFPLIIACIHSPEQAECLPPEQKTLLRVTQLFEAGELEKALSVGNSLLHTTKNPYIHLGLLYNLAYVCFFRKEYDEARRYILLFQMEIRETDPHREELELLLTVLKSELMGIAPGPADFGLDPSFPYSEDITPFLAPFSILAETMEQIRSYPESRPVNPAPYEILCKMIRSQGYFYCEMFLHYYLSLVYEGDGDTERERYHLKQSIDIALRENLVFTLAGLMGYSPDPGFALLEEYPAEVQTRFRSLSANYMDARHKFPAYQKKKSVLPNLTKTDIALISCCLKNFSVEKMAETFSLSQSGMKKRLRTLYQKMGAESKREMMNVYIDSMFR